MISSNRLRPLVLVVLALGFARVAFAQAPGAESASLDIFGVVLGVAGGLALFLYGVTVLADALRDLAGDRVRSIMARLTTNRAAGIATGTVATTILDSSSVTIIMVIAMVDAGILTFVQSLGVVMGANIGTTISSQIIAFDIDRYAPLALVAGLGLQMMGRTETWRNGGRVLLGMGLVFFGLGAMDLAVEPLSQQAGFAEWMTRLENPLLGAAIGALVTIILQSSSATLGVVITLAGQGLLTLPAGIALMLGAEIGTCADTLLATLGRSRAALRAGVFHLLFNVATVAIGLMLTTQIASVAQAVTPGAGVARYVANAHVLFNVAGVLLGVAFVPWIARALERLIPDRRPPAVTREPSPSAP